MRHHNYADSIRVVGDEDGYHLKVETADGDEFDFRMAMDVAEDLAFGQTVGIRLHFEEGALARATMPVSDDPEAYDTNDPKHPGWVDART